MFVKGSHGARVDFPSCLQGPHGFSSAEVCVSPASPRCKEPWVWHRWGQFQLRKLPFEEEWEVIPIPPSEVWA